MGILPQKIFKFRGSETLFSALVMRYVSRSIDLEPENGKQMQVTINKITESKKTTPSTDLMCLAQQVREGGGGAQLTSAKLVCKGKCAQMFYAK